MITIILQSLFINAIYFIAIQNLSRLRFPLFRFLLIITISTTLGLCLDPMLGGISNTAYICSAVFFMFFQTKKLLISFCYSAFGMLIMFVANIFGAFVFYIIFNNVVFNRENPLHICLLYVMLGIVAYVVSKLLGILIHKKLKGFFNQLSRKYIMYLLFGIILILLFIYYQFFIAPDLAADPFINAAVSITVCVVYLVFLLVAVYMFVTGVRKSIETAHKQELLNQLQNYTSNLEIMYTDMRKFRHDYMNIIAALYGYIENKDLGGLEQYFTNSIIPIEKRIESTNSTLDRLKNIQMLEVKGLVALKLMHAQECGTSVHIEVPDEIQSINFDIIELTRIIGIFIDNAIEASLETERKILEFAILNKDNVKVIIIANSFQGILPPISEIYKDGFSTKGKQHGLGLFTVRQLVDQSDYVILNTYVENNLFVQELKISDNPMDGE